MSISNTYKNFKSICIRNDNRNNELNIKIFQRNLTDKPLEPNLSVRPTPTKYVKMPVINLRREVKENLAEHPIYDIEKQFYPGNSKAPWNGFANNIDTETQLQNRIFPLQNCDQREFVPSTHSDMYSYSQFDLPPMKHDLLFESPDLNNTQKEFNDNEMFNNSTRCQRNTK
jgi:hypothetical protein